MINAEVQHQRRGDRIDEYASALLASLDALGALQGHQASGRRSLDAVSNLWDPETDPSRRWRYMGGASFQDRDRAAEQWLDELPALGWARSPDDPTGMTFRRDDDLGHWTLTIFAPKETSERVNFEITSDTAGGPLPG